MVCIVREDYEDEREREDDGQTFRLEAHECGKNERLELGTLERSSIRNGTFILLLCLGYVDK